MRIIIICVCCISLYSCNKLSPEQKIIKQTLYQKVNIDMFDSIQFKTTMIPFTKFRDKYQYISVVYLEDGCMPCYTEFVNWQNNQDSLSLSEHYTVLFILNGISITNFITKVSKIIPNYCITMNPYHIVLDTNRQFLKRNPELDRWALERSLLINSNDEILLVGHPFASKKMKELFYNIFKEQ